VDAESDLRRLHEQMVTVSAGPPRTLAFIRARKLTSVPARAGEPWFGGVRVRAAGVAEEASHPSLWAETPTRSPDSGSPLIPVKPSGD